MSLKDNFNQALKELLKNEGLVGDGLKGSGNKDADKFRDAVPESSGGESLTPGGPVFSPEETYGAPEGYATGISDRLSEPSRQAESPEPSPEDFIQSVHNRNSPDPFADFDEPVTEATEPARGERTQRPERFEYTTSEQPGKAAPGNEYGSAGNSGGGYDNSAYGNAAYGSSPRGDSGQTYPKTGGAYGGRPYGESSYGNRPYGGGYAPGAGSSFRGGRPPENPYYETEETTIISRNTRINGDVSSFANITVEGSVQGDIKLTKNINVSGKVVGNIECNNAVMAGAQMQGSIASKGQVQMDHDSVLLGNIATQYLDLNGRIKGSVDVGGKAEFKNDAVIVGDITASTISVIDGAVIKGYVNTTFMQESTANVFPEAITVGE